jgi:Holliday junction resolvase RusA-like endonuclease
MKFWIPGPLPGMNEIIAAAKAGGRGAVYAKMKREWTQNVAWHVKAAGIRAKLKRVRLHFHWIEPRNRNGAQRDPDNIESGGQKFVWDGLVLAGVISNDKREQNAGTTHRHSLGAIAGVEVEIEEVTDGT